MSILTFKGGVHPYDGKELSKDIPTRQIYPDGEVVIPVAQHIGAPAKPIVNVGDRVLVGQKIAEANGFVSANIHSSVSGTVKKIEQRLVPNGSKVLSVVIENDEQYEKFEYEKPDDNLSREEKIELIKDCGVVGLGGACFPTHVKLSPKEIDKIDYVIVNAAECEPYITADYRRLKEQPKEVIEGLKIVLSLFENAQGVIAVENNKKDVIEELSKLTENEPKISVAELKTKYPQGAERQVIYVTTGRKINSKMLPADAGCIVDNVQTVLAIYDAVCKTTPSMSRVVTLTGDAMAEPQNYKVKFGMSHAELLEEAGGLKENAKKLISGGPMMGMAMYDLNTPITKTSSSILAMSEDEVEKFEPTNCIRCGRCATVCPSHLVPQMMAQAAERNDLDYFQKLNGMECYECGTCTFVCPAKRRLTQIFKQARRAVMDQNRKK